MLVKGIWAAAAVWVLSVMAAGQAHSQPYLSGMPAPSLVRSQIGGADALDTATRQDGALVVLINSIDSLSDGRRMRRQLTAAEQQLLQSYVQELRKLQAEYAGNAEYRRLAMRYSLDSAFRKEVFERTTTLEWREKYLKDWHELVAAHGPGPSRVEPKSAAPETPRISPPPSAQEVAANPRLSVFGLGLDQQFTLPKCPMEPGLNANEQAFMAMLSQMDRFCWAPVGGLMAGMLGVEPGSIAIHLPQARCPSWVVCQMYATVQVGRLRTVTLNIRDREEATQQLVQKYGKPTKRFQKAWVNEAGMNVPFTDLEWSLDDVYIYYNGMTNTNGFGRVIIKGPSQTRGERTATERKRANEMKF